MGRTARSALQQRDLLTISAAMLIPVNHLPLGNRPLLWRKKMIV
jgi:hypothetical protein